MKQLLSTNEFAKKFDYSAATIRNSRHTGSLAGVKAPPHIKIGKSVRYDVSAVNEWFAQFEQPTDSEQAEG